MTESDNECVSVQEHGRTMAAVRRDMPSTQTLREMAEQFRMFSDLTRVRILWTLTEGPICVCDLAQLLGCSQPVVSQQLRLLRQARLVRFEKKGKSSVYMLDDEHVDQIIRLGLSHVTEESEVRQ